MDGPHANRKIWSQLNIRHENATAQSIAQRALADICQAVGVGAIRDSDELHFRPLIARVGIQKDNPERNEVKRYRPASWSPPAAKAAQAPARAAAPPPQQRTAPAGNRPWAR